MKSNRRKFLLSSLVSVASGLALANCSGGTPDKPSNSANVHKKIYKWKMSTAFPKNFPGSDLNAQKLKNYIEKASDGQLLIEHFGAGEIIPAYEIFDAVRNGTIDCGVSAPYYWISKHKAIPFFCTVPGGMTGIEKFSWINFGGGQALWDKLYSKFNLKGILCGNTGVQMGGWFKKEINSLEDFKGLKMRIPGIGAEIINKLGGTAVNMPPGEIMPALQQGVIDATEWVGPWVDKISGLHKIAKYYYGPGIHEPGTANELVMSINRWQELPNNLKEIIKSACHAIYIESLAEFLHYNSISLEDIKNKYGVKVLNFNSTIMKKMFEVSKSVITEFAALGEIHKEIYNSWYDALIKYNKYQKFSDYGYINERIDTL